MNDASIKNSNSYENNINNTSQFSLPTGELRRTKGIKRANLLLVGFFISIVGIQVVRAGVIGQIYTQIKSTIGTQNVEATQTYKGNSQTIIALKPVDIDSIKSIDINSNKNKSSLLISVAIRPSTDNGVGGEDDEDGQNDTVIYEVKYGDTLVSVSEMFDVSKNTIRWANNLKNDNLKIGQILIVPPMTGIIHEVKKGDSIETIAKKYKADKAEIYRYNGINEKTDLSIGSSIMIPDGEIVLAVTTDNDKKPATNKSQNKNKTKNSSPKKDGSSRLIESYSTDLSGYFSRPIVGGKKTQGLHGHNGIDLGATLGTPVLAAAAGIVSVARDSGYNGGYGEMIMVKHDNGTMTVYAHLSAVYVYEGQIVGQGDTIGALGNTGKSTGPHLHFEVRGAVNPF